MAEVEVLYAGPEATSELITFGSREAVRTRSSSRILNIAYVRAEGVRSSVRPYA